MIELQPVSMIFVKDFVSDQHTRFFTLTDGDFKEVTAKDIIQIENPLVCHDFWMIRDELMKEGSIPPNIFDLDEVYCLISQQRNIRIQREEQNISFRIPKKIATGDIIKNYLLILSKKKPVSIPELKAVSIALLAFREHLLLEAKHRDEYDRLIQIELPIYNKLLKHAAQGICIDLNRVDIARNEIKFEFYESLKFFGKEFNVPYEVMSDDHLRDYLIEAGFNDKDVSLDFIIEYLPVPNLFGPKLQELRKLKATLRILEELFLSQKHIYPIVDIFGTRTSRIIYKNPLLQNLSKKHRKIIIANEGKQLAYVDYDQYEVGIIAALTDDPNITKLYNSGDMYEIFAKEYLKMENFRSAAKGLFLSYAYGMSRKSVVDASVECGVARNNAKTAFSSFVAFENWKKNKETEFEKTGKIATLLGNYIVSTEESPYSKKEHRSMISQIIQGTGSLIFKKALLAICSQIADVRIILPMHDAILFEYSNENTPAQVVKIFSQVMTDALAGKVVGKASISDFS